MESEIHSSKSDVTTELKKSIEEIMTELTKPGKVIIKFHGWRNVCRILDYIFYQEYDLFQNVSGIAFELDGLTQTVGYATTAEQLKRRVLLGKTMKTNINSYQLNNEHNLDLLEGFDSLDRRLKKVQIWGCDFVILEVDLGLHSTYKAKLIPFDNAYYFGIFASTVQALGMVPIIQFKYETSAFESEDESVLMFVEMMYRVNKSLFDFDVKLECLLISQLMTYPLKKSNYSVIHIAEVLVNGLQRALPPAIGGVVFFSEGSCKALALQVDRITKLIDRIPWPIVCGYSWKIPAIIKTGTEDEVFEDWFNRCRSITEMLSMALQSDLVEWKPKPTGITEEFLKSHSYHTSLMKDRWTYVEIPFIIATLIARYPLEIN